MNIFDAIWRKRGRPSQHHHEAPDEVISYTITQTERDYSGILEYGDVAIKFWLPELVGQILDEICSFHHTTRSDLVRQTLFAYLYGRYDLTGLIERDDSNYSLKGIPVFSTSKRTESEVKEPSPDIMQDLGKNTEDLKVWIPRKMKADIQVLADKASISLSEMIREIIISTLIGHTYLSARTELMQMTIEVEDEATD